MSVRVRSMNQIYLQFIYTWWGYLILYNCKLFILGIDTWSINCLLTIINTNFVKHNRYFLSTYFLLDPFLLPYCFYRIRRELIDVFSIIVYIPSTFCRTLGHHQGRIYYKSNVTFVFALLLCKNIFTVGVYSVCF